ncbi:hypothetical protein Q0P47_14395, partial [Staphylococcus aureus]|nr:hypothetical protein [Staphylococcus aureus]
LNQTLEIRLFLLDAADDNGDAIPHPAAAVPLLVVKTRFTERQLAWSERLEYSRRYHLNIIGDYLHYNSEVCEPHWAR